jgi:hypothetical protein
VQLKVPPGSVGLVLSPAAVPLYPGTLCPIPAPGPSPASGCLPLFFFFFFVVLGFELGAYTLSYSASPFLWVSLREGLKNYLPGLASNHDLPDLCLPL